MATVKTAANVRALAMQSPAMPMFLKYALRVKVVKPARICRFHFRSAWNETVEILLDGNLRDTAVRHWLDMLL